MPENSVFDSENSSAIDPRLSRRTLLALGALAGAALALPALPARADTASYSDITALRFLGEVALVEADFFARAANSSIGEGMKERELNAFALIAKEDAELARWFKAALQRQHLGAASTFFTPNLSTSRPIPVYRFDSSAFSTREGLYSTAISIKETAVGGFHGVVGDADSPKMIQAFAALAGVQGRHLAILEELVGQNPFVTTEAALSRKDVASKLDAYGFKREVMA